MHILFLSDNFPPEVNAPASRTFEHCREWVRAGHEVTVITCAPNFPKGEVFAGYRNRLWQRETVDGIRVLRVWTYIAANEGFAKRILDYVSFMISAIIASLFVRKIDVVIGTSPQFFAACAGYVVGGSKRVPWIFELRDIWPESIRAVGAMKESRVLDWLEKVEMFLYRRADAIVSVTHAFRETLIRRGVNPDKIYVVTNGVDTSRFSPRAKDKLLLKELDLAGRFVGGYIGTHGMAHALDTVLDAAALMLAESDGNQFRFILLGDGANKRTLVARAEREGLSNVIFVDSVPKEEVVRYWSILDVSIIHLKRSDLFTTVIPSKLFECMAMAIPVLHGVAGESADIVNVEKVGLTFEPEDPKALCDGMRRLREDHALYDRLRENGPRAALRYDRAVLGQEMLGIISRVVSR
ncbi:glycosyltransferase family 4 protein [Lentisalinibacter sediminis]|uniref:glycosyltransferase family 4 protein n=1 Tax=Lentisalinibacter sediminis TaxID=2992237 RepID=UPI00386725D1